MGSYLSIVNNTEDTYVCKIGPDEAALKIAGIIISVVGAAAAVIGTGGAAAPVAANGVVSVVGVSATAITTVKSSVEAIKDIVDIAGTVSDFGYAIAEGVTEHLISEGFVTIPPGQSHQWGKMSLSLWQQGTCVRTTIMDEKTVRTDTVYMRPIFSGATDGSNNDHQIQFWIDKFGFETETAVAS